MSTFIKLLPLELKEIDDYSEPRMEMGRGDHLAGNMSDDLKKLYTLWIQYDQRLDEARVKHKFGKVKDLDILGAQLREVKSKAEAIREIFWIAVYSELGLWDKSCIGVRKGFKVVWFDDEPEQSSDLPPFLRRIFHLGDK